MATDTAHAPATEHHDEHAHGAHAHPSDLQYIWVAVALGLLTALEVSTYFFDFGPALVPTLVVLMIIKFALVILFFMHLKFDNPLFMKLFIAGLILAVGVYMVMLSAFEFFHQV
jgi:cytochrome c oxidase subunit 4